MDLFSRVKIDWFEVSRDHNGRAGCSHWDELSTPSEVFERHIGCRFQLRGSKEGRTGIVIREFACFFAIVDESRCTCLGRQEETLFGRTAVAPLFSYADRGASACAS